MDLFYILLMPRILNPVRLKGMRYDKDEICGILIFQHSKRLIYRVACMIYLTHVGKWNIV